MEEVEVMRLDITEFELVELIEILSNRIQYNPELIPLYEKLLKKQPKVDHSKINLDYEIPMYTGKKQ